MAEDVPNDKARPLKRPAIPAPVAIKEPSVGDFVSIGGRRGQVVDIRNSQIDGKRLFVLGRWHLPSEVDSDAPDGEA